MRKLKNKTPLEMVKTRTRMIHMKEVMVMVADLPKLKARKRRTWKVTGTTSMTGITTSSIHATLRYMEAGEPTTSSVK